MKFYRYEIGQIKSLNGLFPDAEMKLVEFELVKETPKGYWISKHYSFATQLHSKSRWVSKTARKRYAYPTKEQALINAQFRAKKKNKNTPVSIGFCEVIFT